MYRIALLILLVSNTAFAQDTVQAEPTWPLAWQGTWRVTAEVMDCETNEVIGMHSLDYGICEGEPLFKGAACTGTIDDISFAVDCSLDFGSCNIQVEASGSIETGSFAGRATIDMAGISCPEPLCQIWKVTADRVSFDADCGPVTIDSLLWGSIKGKYHEISQN